MSDANLLDVRHLTKKVGPRQVVNGVSLQVNRGEIVALLGRDQSGMSATLKIIAGTLKPDAGSVLVQGKTVGSLAEAELATGPTLLILDEPFSGVAPADREALQAAILRLAGRGFGILFTEHDVRGSLDFCDRAYVMADGRIATSGSASGLLSPQ